MNLQRPEAPAVRFILNGKLSTSHMPGHTRLADVLRDEFGFTGVKIGCNAGDCGACTILLDGKQICACLTPLGQAAGKVVVTVEGLMAHGTLTRVQRAFQKHGAAQCGICTPGMLMAAVELLGHREHPTESETLDALGGVLCRCTGYRKIVEAVLDAASEVNLPALPEAGAAVGARVPKVDGIAKITGAEVFGADGIPKDALWLRAIRSPHARARFTIGDLADFRARHPRIERIIVASDIPFNGFGIYPDLKDQPVLADGEVRYRGEAVLALVGTRDAVEAVREAELPIHYEPEEPVTGIDAAMRAGRAVQAARPDNLLISGKVRRGDVEQAVASAVAVAEGVFDTSFVEHAYIEPEAGWARRVGDRIEVHATTQAPAMDLEEVANVLRIARDQVRIVPTACGGGFGGKLDVSVQPLLALAAWVTGRPVAWVYTRPESMMASTKRHPARVIVRFACDASGRLLTAESDALFDTGAYASWGPTVANRVPVHATGPYAVPNVRTTGRAYFTNAPPAGAFRGFGVPQAAIAHEAMMDSLADELAIDRLEFRRINALRVGDVTATGQRLEASAGLVACLDALAPRWQAACREVAAFNQRAQGALRRGVGIGCMWYGIGNTSMSNPSTMRVGIDRNGAVTFYNGAVDIGQGSNTILSQILADAIGIPISRIRLVMGDTDRTADAGKTSASRQTFVSGRAAEAAGLSLRAAILRFANAGEEARIEIGEGRILVEEAGHRREIDLGMLEPDANGDVVRGEGRFDPPTTPLDGDGQGIPYATYAFAAQMAVVEVDMDLGTTRVLSILAAHDVGRAINPVQVEGQIQGGIAQGLGLALMEEYLPGRTENLHDYLIPTIGDVPPIEVLMIEEREPLGPSGAKGVGEPGLVPTAPAILGAIHHATGVRPVFVPVTPDRLRAAIRERRGA
ncbi:MAG: molybdopterin-dependent oxidoreductase [Alphaproteobacteria bacterium]|nr:molybdopterin-dependent oxidoreductase [Alphaproteobacteria bacterium]